MSERDVTKSSKDRVAWDSCVFIEAIDEINGLPDRRVDVAKLIKWARDDGTLDIVGCVMVTVEVLHLGGKDNAANRRAIANFLDNPYFHLRSVSEVTAAKARDVRRMARSKGKKVTPTDAAHIATALLEECDALLTYDEHVLAADGLFTINKRKLRVLTPKQWIDKMEAEEAPLLKQE